MQALEPIAMRLEVSRGINHCTIINDTYNSDVNSLDIALDFLNRRASESASKTVVILSDILQSGMEADDLYSEVAEMVNARKPQLFVGVGRKMCAHAELFDTAAKFFATTQD